MQRRVKDALTSEEVALLRSRNSKADLLHLLAKTRIVGINTQRIIYIIAEHPDPAAAKLIADRYVDALFIATQETMDATAEEYKQTSGVLTKRYTVETILRRHQPTIARRMSWYAALL